MRYFIFILLLIALGGALLGQWAVRDSGRILLSYGDIFVETSLWFGIFLLFCSFFLVLVLFRLIAGFLRLPRRMRRWRQNRSDRRAVEQLRRGVLDLMGGYAARAYASMHASARTENKLVAAESAYRLKKYEQAMNLLRGVKQEKLDGESRIRASRAIGFIRARIHYDCEEYREALAALDPMMREAKKNERLHGMLKALYIKTAQWRELAELLRAAEGFSGREERLCHYRTYMKHETDAAVLTAFWRSLPARERKDPLLIGCYAVQLAQRGEHAKAEMVLTTALKKKYDGLLVDAYSEIESDRPLKQLHFLETLLRKGCKDKSMLAALARLAFRNRRAPQARDYYERLISNYQAEPADRLAYAELLSQSENETDRRRAQKIFHSLAGAAANLAADAKGA